MNKKKLKFGVYRITAQVAIDEQIDLEDHFTPAEWDAIKPRDRQACFEEYIDTQASNELDFEFDIVD